MKPVSPVLGEAFADREIVIAKDQPEYMPLPAIRSDNGVVLTRWKLTDGERQAVTDGADIFLSVWTFGSIQPIRLEVQECERGVETMALQMGLVPLDFNTELPEYTVFSQVTIQVPDLTANDEQALKEKQWQETLQS
jgi:hypothetical protein